MPLGTLHYVFPSKELLITAVLEDIREEVSAVFNAAETDAGLDHAIRHGLDNYWVQLVINDPAAALMRHELFVHALRTPGLESMARWQIEGYNRIVAERCQEAANNAGELCVVPFDTLGRIVVGSVIGITLQYLSDRDQARARRDLHAITDILTHLAATRPATSTATG